MTKTKIQPRSFSSAGKTEVHFRRARPGDADALVGLKAELAFDPGAPLRGGFLLGTSLERYRYFIEHDWVFLAEKEGRLVGFAIVLAHETFAASNAWQKGDAVRWTVSSEVFGARLAYFEQLAFLPQAGVRTYAKYLSFLSAQRVLKTHDGLFATVVRKPVYNRAVLPFLKVTGFEQVGDLDEHYPGVGEIVSDVYYLSREVFVERLELPAFKRFLPRAEGWLLDDPSDDPYAR